MKLFLVALLLLTFACGQENAPAVDRSQTTAGEIARGSTSGELARAPLPAPPSAEEAAQLISGSAEFSDYQFTRAAFTLPVKEDAMTPEVRTVSKALAKSGWIGIDGDGNVVLTAKAKSDKRFLLRQNGFIDIVPMAKKEFLGVSAVHLNPEGQPLVDFRWKWVPNEIGTLTDRYTGEQLAVATLLWDGSQWSVLRITPKAS